MKRLLCSVLVLLLVFSLSITAFAENDTDPAPATPGTITITNVTPGKEYTVYKLFDAFYNSENDSISYTIETDNQFYSLLFGPDGTPTADNKCFEIVSGKVQRVTTVTDDELTQYVNDLIGGASGLSPAVEPQTPGVGVTTLTFTVPEYGYYVVTSTLGSFVTITNNTANVEVIDKNQNPGDHGNFSKLVWNDATGAWDTRSTSAVGELVKYKVDFNGMNYDGDKEIQYYTVYDEKGGALWVEFGTKDSAYLVNNIKITVGDDVLKRGYYLPIGEINTNEWDYLGDWSGVDQNRDNAEWYLVHESYDKFRFMIPWMSGHKVTGDNTPTYGLDFPDDAGFLYDSNVPVTIEYCASVEYNAEVGGGNRNLFNRAQLNWTCAKDTGNSAWQEVNTEVYGIALRKIDSKDSSALAGAEFAVYSDEACTEPFYVIPTNIEGVYIKDDYGCVGQQITGQYKQTARAKYDAYLGAYLNGETQKNVVTTPINGKIVILGLDAGTYYLLETKAPDGYNALDTKFEIHAGTGMDDFHVFATDAGKVEDLQAAAGNYKDHIYYVTDADVKNSQGVELPSTGGEGTMMLVTFGTVISLLFAVLLITHKKMSVYHD